MLAYRHAFHAGNHADVLKHIVFMRVLRYLNQKDKPYRLVDTHAGAGGYSLEGQYAQKKNEYVEGIGRLWEKEKGGEELPEAVADYLACVRQFNPDGKLTQYPGSPAFAQMLLRPQDQLRLFELHNTDHRILASYVGDAKGVQVFNADGFDGLKGQLPPPSRRGAVLMDPSYEGHHDYGRVIASLREALLRFAEGVYMIWYPQVTKLEAAQLPRRLEALAPKGFLHVRLTVQPLDSQGFGLAGSGMFILNPPYTLHDEMAELLPWLVEALGQYDGANYLIEQRAA
ncbi:23S rRNA (adenine(2030)-N(6))-methyltransferase RlmJ [Rhizobacter sp. J219]|jgi:23S rRNA (adenine2030-N6)-methyltransferase|uniref:23S rRNA (adenine(2030)-N(6))-methyltransferase RlmJ n=1 Tax=Rhizobacter sp. J219 TaxID=2898430 RepID=UPI002150FBCA|nr:23S rRNA (adenine(2030)-N(6))-methyltransferase RlmJ [Rhizobacter sp. J219]MCR5884483.1 23S rRNA (adenine(2030)-N(6))-methyltransferase RlmJ [Rhizobacter sp. J219]